MDGLPTYRNNPMTAPNRNGNVRMKIALARVESADEHQRRVTSEPWPLALRVVGAGLLLVTGAIHLDLYVTGYRTIPTIGWLFFLQVVSALGLGLGLLVSANRWVSLAGAGLSIATLAGYLLSLQISLFGFREVRTTTGIVAGIIEVLAFTALATAGLRAPTEEELAPQRSLGSGLQSGLVAIRWSAATLSLAAAILLGISYGTTAPGSTDSSTKSTVLNARTIAGSTVVTNAKGYTLYWFVPDTATKSVCYGTCAVYWPPVTGTLSRGAGVTGRVGTVRRNGGGKQVTYDNHPLYTYVGDSAPGQANGDNINLNGGVWHEMNVRG